MVCSKLNNNIKHNRRIQAFPFNTNMEAFKGEYTRTVTHTLDTARMKIKFEYTNTLGRAKMKIKFLVIECANYIRK